jgi:hypothetical protein
MKHSGMELSELSGLEKWTARAAFPWSEELGDRLFKLGEHLYAATNPRHGSGDPIYCVGWAESDYWALRIWTVPFRGDIDAPSRFEAELPRLHTIGGPLDLAHGAVKEFEGDQPDARKATLVTARYRMTDGACIANVISGSDGRSYFYADPNPKPNDLPVAIEIRLKARTS